MSVMEGSLWPEFRAPEVIPPVAILREQAGYLAHETNRLVEAEVVTMAGPDDVLLIHDLVLRVRALGDYSRSLLQVYQKASAYPVQVRGAGQLRTCENPDDYRRVLKDVFEHPDTTSLIETLLDVAKSSTRVARSA